MGGGEMNENRFSERQFLVRYRMEKVKEAMIRRIREQNRAIQNGKKDRLEVVR